MQILIRFVLGGLVVAASAWLVAALGSWLVLEGLMAETHDTESNQARPGHTPAGQMARKPTRSRSHFGARGQ
jgi:hypothetical protein